MKPGRADASLSQGGEWGAGETAKGQKGGERKLPRSKALRGQCRRRKLRLAAASLAVRGC